MLNSIQKSRWRIKATTGKTGAGKNTECVRCMGCEVICSFMKERFVNPELSRIRIEAKELEWIDGDSKRIVTQRICRQCPGETPCMKACPVESAIYREPRWNTVLIDHSKCTRCGDCIKACPYGAVWYNSEKDAIIKCDLCGGEPECVRWCPVGVLQFTEIGRKEDEDD